MKWEIDKKYFESLYDEDQLKILEIFYKDPNCIILKDSNIFNKEKFDKLIENIRNLNKHVDLSYSGYSFYYIELNYIINHFLTCDDILVESKNIIVCYDFSITYNLVKRSLNQRNKLDNVVLDNCIYYFSWVLSANAWNYREICQETIKLIIDHIEKPTTDLLERVCNGCNNVIIKYVLEKGLKPTVQAFLNCIISSASCIDVNCLFESGWKFKNWSEMYSLLVDSGFTSFQRLCYIDISKAFEVIDRECVLKMYEYGVDVPTLVLENNKADMDCLRAVCKSDNLTLAKKMVKKYKLKFDHQCLENACAMGNRKIIKHLTEKCYVRLTDKCLVNYMKRVKKKKYVQKLFDMKEVMDGQEIG
ncbi:MAG: hypothetical protein Harvfovirus5_23 [Harvfovirus sp.]|uniref:Ankyrin repeat protein n=1 Tax=Harvfovirus sp. TaxID=2487768 RepID=A0A3G5A5F3_9VIRU|nr:MAG: hypothetical protein Harvfovirus5_23 [Harvfovirus sp.]